MTVELLQLLQPGHGKPRGSAMTPVAVLKTLRTRGLTVELPVDRGCGAFHRNAPAQWGPSGDGG